MPMPTPKESKKTVRIFAIASFLNDMGSDMIYPLWPLFVTSVLGADMAVLGLIDGLGDAVVSLSQAFSGYLSDKIRKRKVFIWLGYFFAALSHAGYAFARTWPQLIPLRVLDRSGKIRNAPRDAIVADLSTRTDRGKNFGILRTMDNLGAVCGILFAVAFFHQLGYHKLFLIAGIPSLLASLLVFGLIREKKQVGALLFKGLRLKDLTPNFRFFLILSAIFAIGSFSYSFLLVFAQKSGIQLSFIPLFYLLFTAVASVSSLPAGKLADRFGRKPLMLVGFLLWAAVSITLLMNSTFFGITLAFILYGFHKGVTETVQKTFVAELVPEEYRASGIGGFQMVIGLCALPASFIAGLLWDTYTSFAPFVFSLGLTLVAIILLLFVDEGHS